MCVCHQAFNVVFEKAVERAEKNDEVKVRVANLIDTVTFSVFNYTARGLFERDKLIFTSQVCFQVGKAAVAADTAVILILLLLYSYFS